MHVLTLIGCVLFSDVGLRDRGRRRGKDGGGEGVVRGRCWMMGRVYVCLWMWVCMCGLDEPPEFSLQLWEEEKWKRGNKVRPGGNQEPKSNWFPPLSLYVFIFEPAVLKHIVSQGLQWIFSEGGPGGCTTRKPNLEKTDRVHNWNTNRLTSFIRLNCKGVATTINCSFLSMNTCYPLLKGTKQPHWEKRDVYGRSSHNKRKYIRNRWESWQMWVGY